MGFSKLVLPDVKYRRNREHAYYKNKSSISNLINYALGVKKTYIKNENTEEKVHYCDSNCVNIYIPRKAAEQMKAVKKFFKKTDGRQACHYMLSFDKTVKDPKKVYEIGLEIMYTFFNEYQTIFAVHENTDNLHIHFVFNSVSYVTGKKWSLNDKEWHQLKEAIESKANSHFYTINDLLK